MNKWMVALTGAAALTTACAQAPQEPVDRLDRVEPADPQLELEPPALFGEGTFIEALTGRLDGAVGPATGLNHEAQSVSFYDDGFYTQANVVVEADSGAAMGIISINGSMRALSEAGGGVRTCQEDFYDPNSDVNSGGLAASFTGCANAGDMDDGWSYDAPADCTDMDIGEPMENAPEGTVATLSVLAHWSEQNWGEERTVKATLHLTER